MRTCDVPTAVLGNKQGRTREQRADAGSCPEVKRCCSGPLPPDPVSALLRANVFQDTQIPPVRASWLRSAYSFQGHNPHPSPATSMLGSAVFPDDAEEAIRQRRNECHHRCCRLHRYPYHSVACRVRLGLSSDMGRCFGVSTAWSAVGTAIFSLACWCMGRR